MAGAREQDQYMPIANVIRIMRKILPPHAKISDDAKETIQECVSEYISFVTAEANDRCICEQRKTVTAEDVLWAMGKLGFDDYVQPLAIYLQRYRESEGEPASVRRASASAAAAAAAASTSASALGVMHPPILPQHPPILPLQPILPLPPQPLQPPQPAFVHPHGFGMFDSFDSPQRFFRDDGAASGSGSAGPSNFITNFDPFGNKHGSL